MALWTVCIQAQIEDGDFVIGKLEEQGYPVIYRFSASTPTPELMKEYPWLTVLSWEYSKSDRNGMPPVRVNERMLILEESLSDSFLESAGAHWVYNRTGNGKKEFVFYIRDRSEFTIALNSTLATHQRYPIDMTFYPDNTWQDYLELVDIFKEAAEKRTVSPNQQLESTPD